MHFSGFLLLADTTDGGLRVRGQDARLRVDHAQRTEHERLVLSRGYRWDRRVPRKRCCYTNYISLTIYNT